MAAISSISFRFCSNISLTSMYSSPVDSIASHLTVIITAGDESFLKPRDYGNRHDLDTTGNLSVFRQLRLHGPLPAKFQLKMHVGAGIVARTHKAPSKEQRLSRRMGL